MCDPITLAVMAASTATTFAGTGMAAGDAAKNNNRIAEARNRVLRDTNRRNDELSANNRDNFNSRIDQLEPAPAAAALDTAQQARTSTIDQNLNTTATEAPLAGDAPKVVKSDLARALADSFAKSKDQAKALGKFGGYGDQAKDNAVADSGLGLKIGTNNNFVRGNIGIMPHLQDFAEIRATKPASPLGGILQALGQAGSMYAGSRGMAPKAKISGGSLYN